MLQVILIVVMIAVGAASFAWGKRHREVLRQFRPAAPYLFILLAALFGYLDFTAHERRAWWFVPPLLFLIMAVIEVVRQRRLNRAGH